MRLTLPVAPAVAVCCLLALSPTSAFAADGEGKFAVDGIGRLSCADFSAAMSGDEPRRVAAFASWTNGFVTGFNVHQPETFDLTPWQTVELMLAKVNGFCTANPDVPYIAALGRLLVALKDARVAEASELVTVRAGEQGVYLYPETLAEIRTALNAAGFEMTTPEGSFDDSFAAALRGYQAARDLPESGLPDQPTLNALFP